MWYHFFLTTIYPTFNPALFPLCYGRSQGWAPESTDALAQALNSKVISPGFPLSSLKKRWHLEYILYIKTQSNKLTKVERSAASKHSGPGSNHIMSRVSLQAGDRRCSAHFRARLSKNFQQITVWSLKPRTHLLPSQQRNSSSILAVVLLVNLNSTYELCPWGNSYLLLAKVGAEARHISSKRHRQIRSLWNMNHLGRLLEI